DRTLTCGSVTDAAIQGPVQADNYTVSAQAGDVFTVKLARTDTTGNFLPFGEIYDPTGKLITNIGATVVSPHALALANFTATVPGTYTILAEDGYDGTQKGSYSVALSRLNRPCGSAGALGCSTVIDASIDGILRQNVYTLSAKANDSFLLRLLRSG